MNLSNKEIEITCPECKAKNKTTLQKIANQEIINCLGCKKSIKLTDEDGSVKKSISSVDNSLKALFKK
jgi:Zn ribbon nucleic-acid-binding protein